MSMAKSTAFCAVSDPSVPTPMITALPLAVRVARERALLRHLRVLAVPDGDRAAERGADDHAEHDPAGPAVRHLHDGVAEHRRHDEEDPPLDCDACVHDCLRASLKRGGPRTQTPSYAAANRRHSAGIPLSGRAPRSRKPMPDPATRSLTVRDPSTSPAAASAPTRAAM